MNYNNIINKYWTRCVKTTTAIILTALLLVAITSCSLNRIIEEAYFKSDIVPNIPDIDIDETEIGEISIHETNLKKMYDIKDEFIDSDSGLRDPFEPFYIKGIDEDEKNILSLKAIYIKNQVEYAEILYNDHEYLLKEDDIFSEIYLVDSINPDSVILLKGDELITLFLNEMKYD